MCICVCVCVAASWMCLVLGYIRHGVAFTDCLRSIKSIDRKESGVVGWVDGWGGLGCN